MRFGKMEGDHFSVWLFRFLREKKHGKTWKTQQKSGPLIWKVLEDQGQFLISELISTSNQLSQLLLILSLFIVWIGGVHLIISLATSLMPQLFKMLCLVFLFILLISFFLVLGIKILSSPAQLSLLREGLYEKALLWGL